MESSWSEEQLMAEENRERKSRAVKEMIRMLNSQESSRFHVMLFKYYIDTEPYSTSALTISQASTPNMREAPNGFECDAFFSSRHAYARRKGRKRSNQRRN